MNGHFCYVYKFGLITNGLGIVRYISFYNKDFLEAHPDIVVDKKSRSPEEDKSLSDSKALLPVLKDFFLKHSDHTLTQNGIPCCPHDSTLPMKPEGNISHLKCGIPTFKFVCPKMKWTK